MDHRSHSPGLQSQQHNEASPARGDASSHRQRNADYRWTVPKVAAFLDALSQSGSVAAAARKVGMSRQSAYRLRKRLNGPLFAAAFEGARAKGRVARVAEKQRAASPWEGPGLAALDHLRAADQSDRR